MIEEKSLSDRGSYTIEVVTDYDIGKVGGHTVWRKEEDIKEFIKRLKEGLYFLNAPDYNEMFKLINKLAGEELAGCGNKK